MAIPKTTIWPLDEHTKVKHEILRLYLEAWFPILATLKGRILFFDGFCGPGRYSGGEEGSPLVALNTAANHRAKLTNELVFYFVDENQARIDHLTAELGQRTDPTNFKKMVRCAKFHEVMKEILDKLDADHKQLAPTFAFVDPFGFGGIPFELIARLLKHPQTELLINFDVDSMNRFITQIQVAPQIIEAVGDPGVVEVVTKAPDRIAALRHFYQQQLKKHASFVRYFEMLDRRGQTSYYLFFASKNRLGHLKFKEALWRVDPTGEFRFSDATAEQPVLFGDKPEDQIPAVRRLLENRYSGHSGVRRNAILTYLEDETPFLSKHMNCALKAMETDAKISVNAQKEDGKKRVKNTFPEGTLINFAVRL